MPITKLSALMLLASEVSLVQFDADNEVIGANALSERSELSPI